MPWSHIIGHDAWVTAFRHVASRGRLAHAYLFVGPEGVGKKLFAVELGKTLLCEKRDGANFEACIRIFRYGVRRGSIRSTAKRRTSCPSI